MYIADSWEVHRTPTANSGVCLLSKLSQLKQKAYQAGKDRNWDLAISVYERILELEKSNPTIINELGDLCLKSGDGNKAISHFLSAAAKYRKIGLLNNSVAICKKILRHDDENVHAHWYMAEIRSSQDLLVEGETHGLAFLNAGNQMTGEIHDIFLKRCVKLLELYPASLNIMKNLALFFHSRQMLLEAGRATCLQACVVFDSGKEESARKLMGGVLANSPELKNYSEFIKWSKRVDPDAEGSESMADYNSVTLDGAGEVPETQTASSAEPQAEPEVQPVEAADEKAPGGENSSDVPEDSTTADNKDDEGCLVIDVDDSPDVAELIAQASQEAAAEEPGDQDEPSAGVDPVESVDLLDQILSEDSDAALVDESAQVDTIAAEIGNVVGGDGSEDDADRFYEMGMVYLEMGLFDKACDSFEIAAADDDYTIRAHEMWGITLQRAKRPDEAITVLTSGLQYAEADSRENLGLRYHIAMAHELADRNEAAIEIYEEIQAVAPNFLDITKRLSQLAGV